MSSTMLYKDSSSFLDICKKLIQEEKLKSQGAGFNGGSTLEYLVNNNTTNTSDYWNPPCEPPNPSLLERGFTSQIILVTLYSLSSVFSLCGNVIVVWVLACGNRWRLDLTAFLINLAVSDICIAIFCIPFTFTEIMLGRWIFSRVMCPFVLFMQNLSVQASVFTNMAIGFDRYWAVVHPLKSRLTKKRSKIVIGMVWVFAVGLSSVQLVVSRAADDSMGVTSCHERWGNHQQQQAYTLVVFALLYIVPLMILCMSYLKVGFTLWDRTPPGNADTDRDIHNQISKCRVIKMLVVIVVAFAICWLPIHIFTLITHFLPLAISSYMLTQRGETIMMGLFFSSHWLAMSHAFVNPIIYGFLNDTFRGDLRMMLPCFKRRLNHPRSRTTSFLSIHSATSSQRVVRDNINVYISRTPNDRAIPLLGYPLSHMKTSASTSTHSFRSLC